MICSSLIARAFAKVRYPILPEVTPSDEPEARGIFEWVTGRTAQPCGLFHTASPENRCAELGIALVKPGVAGRGYGTDATRTLCRFGFDEMNLHRIELLVFAQNTAARRVYEKVGFAVEAVARQAHWGDGRWYDDVHMALLEGELR